MLCSRRTESDRVSQVSARVRRRGREHIELTAEASQSTSASLSHILLHCSRSVLFLVQEVFAERAFLCQPHCRLENTDMCLWIAQSHNYICSVLNGTFSTILLRTLRYMPQVDRWLLQSLDQTHLHHSVTHQRSLPNNMHLTQGSHYL